MSRFPNKQSCPDQLADLYQHAEGIANLAFKLTECQHSAFIPCEECVRNLTLDLAKIDWPAGAARELIEGARKSLASHQRHLEGRKLPSD